MSNLIITGFILRNQITFSRQLCVLAICICKGEIVFIDAIDIFADRCRCRAAIYPWKFPTNGVVATPRYDDLLDLHVTWRIVVAL